MSYGPEARIQRAIVQWVKVALPEVVVHHSDSGSADLGRRRFLHWVGAQAGWPDLIVVGKGEGRAQVRLCAIEVKSKRGRLSDKQADMLKELREFGAVAGVARSVEEAESMLLEAGFIPKVRPASVAGAQAPPRPKEPRQRRQRETVECGSPGCENDAQWNVWPPTCGDCLRAESEALEAKDRAAGVEPRTFG